MMNRNRAAVAIGAELCAGIVADSVPAREYEECQNKARAVLRAFELAEKGL